MSATTTKVIFRQLFPDIPASPGHCLSYERIGQHGAADYAGVIARTVRATPEDSASLKRELESLGYVLDVKLRR